MTPWFPFAPHEPVLSYRHAQGARLHQRLTADGLVVVRGVVPPDACDEAAQAMATWLKRRGGVDVADPATWGRYTPEHFEMSPSIPGMMNTGPVRRAAFVREVRGRPEVRRLFERIYGTADLRMEAGGVFWSFPPEHYPRGRNPSELDGGFWHWRNMWMHTDRGRQNPAKPTCLMTAILLEDAELHDYGFAYLSGSHRLHDEFFRKHPSPLEMETPGGGYHQLTFENTKWFEEKGCEWRKVVAPKGTVIVWNDRLLHSTCLPSRGRPRPKPRFVIYGGFTAGP